MTVGLTDQVAERVAEHTALLAETIKDEFRAGLTQTERGLRITAGRAVTLNGSGSQLVAFSGGRVIGWSLRETSGSAGAVLRLRDGRDAAAPLLFPITLASGIAQTISLPGSGISYGDGLYLEAVSGVFEGSVLLGVVD